MEKKNAWIFEGIAFAMIMFFIQIISFLFMGELKLESLWIIALICLFFGLAYGGVMSFLRKRK